MTSFSHRMIKPGMLVSGLVATITEGGREYRYSLDSRHERAAFKAWAVDTFAGGMNCKRLVGRWPYYEVKQP